jgi:hypothetical protein
MMTAAREQASVTGAISTGPHGRSEGRGNGGRDADELDVSGTTEDGS